MGSWPRVNDAEIARAICTSIVDDGIGGAKADDAGTGLIGLVDRVEALGGRLTLSSPEGVGTLAVEEGKLTIAVGERVTLAPVACRA